MTCSVRRCIPRTTTDIDLPGSNRHVRVSVFQRNGSFSSPPPLLGTRDVPPGWTRAGTGPGPRACAGDHARAGSRPRSCPCPRRWPACARPRSCQCPDLGRVDACRFRAMSRCNPAVRGTPPIEECSTMGDQAQRSEREAELVQALVDLKAATEARRRLDADAPDWRAVLRREREAMDRVKELVSALDRPSV
jgi:hypothetical protein